MNIRLVSVVIPAYRQEKTIQKDLIHIDSVLKQLRYPYEMIVVVDGEDDKTLQNARKVKSSHLKIISYKQNQGKGHAVRKGMKIAAGDLIGFVDSGMDLNPNSIAIMLEHMEWYKADIIVGSKLHPVSKIHYPLSRRVLSFGYRTLVRMLFGLKVRDTQVGMKFFRRAVVKKVLPRLVVKTYAFDIEFLAVANNLGFTRIYEAPVQLDFTGASTIVSKGFWRTISFILLDTLIVFYRLRILKYYQTKKRKRFTFSI